MSLTLKVPNPKHPLYLIVLMLVGYGGAIATNDIDGSRTSHKASPISIGLDIQYGYLLFHQYKLSDSTKLTDKSNALNLYLESLAITSFGKIGLGFGLGFSTVRDVTVDGGRSASVYTYPAEAYLSYRFDLTKNQLLVPFAKAGTGFTWVRQTSSNGATQPEAGNFSFNYSLGMAICLNRIEPKHAMELDKSAGVNNTYLLVEYVNTIKLGPKDRPDISHHAYRLGLRFEI